MGRWRSVRRGEGRGGKGEVRFSPHAKVGEEERDGGGPAWNTEREERGRIQMRERWKEASITPTDAGQFPGRRRRCRDEGGRCRCTTRKEVRVFITARRDITATEVLGGGKWQAQIWVSAVACTCL